jgi:hypothetical protein
MFLSIKLTSFEELHKRQNVCYYIKEGLQFHEYLMCYVELHTHTHTHTHIYMFNCIDNENGQNYVW